MSYINNSHLKKHNLTPKEFKQKFPDFNHIDDESRKLMGGAKTNAILAKKLKRELRLEKEEIEYNEKPKKCEQCGKLILFEFRNKRFCDIYCATIFTNKNRKIIYSEETLERLRECAKKNLKKVIPKDRKTFILSCKICDKKFTVFYEKKHKKTCSEECRKKAHSLYNHKQTKTYGICGYYKGIYCGSSWELAFLIFNLDAGKKVERCQITIPYEYNGEQHNYFPDFIMDNVIYEIKGFENEDVKIKTQATIHAGFEIVVLRKKEINPIIKDLKKRYGVKDITVLYDSKI